VKVDTLPTGNMNYVQDNMCFGQLPKRLVIACVDSDALNGTIGKKRSISNTIISILWRSTLTDDRFQPNPYSPTSKTMATSDVIWDSTTVPKKYIKTKEIPFREKIMPKETRCLDLISHPTCLKLEPFSL